MKDRKATLKQLTNQLQNWTLVGPILLPPGTDKWIPMELDAAREMPTAIRQINGHEVVMRKVKTDGPLIDFRKYLSTPGGLPQAFAFTEIETPEEGTLTLTYDADHWAVLWVDGNEVSATRQGNQGGLGEMKHPVVVGLNKGKHTLAVRIISGIGGWALILNLTDWQSGIADILRTDRDARWRDYTKTMVRHENRSLPDGNCGGVSKEKFELLMANLGVDARWIAVVHNCEGSYYQSKHLPMWPGAKPEYEKELKEWVELLHQHRISALSWYALCLCGSAWEKYPEWRQKYLVEPAPGSAHQKWSCCINSPYGEAVINYAIESLQKFDLDGFWFDGSAFTPIWDKPQPISCVCQYCQAKFRADTGLELPVRYDWSKTEFRRWVQWRYDMFSEYWQHLVDRVHAVIPQATIVYNHYHRELIGWNGAVPLNPFGHNFISGTEADGEPLKGMFHTRCMRAYGRLDTEVWMGIGGVRKNTVRGPMNNPRLAMDFVIACSTAGGHASVGPVDNSVEAPVLGRIADELKTRAEYLNLPSVPYIALHVSQQSDTFVFGRNPRYTSEGWTDYYWMSLTGWHHLLAHAGLTCDVIFDDHLTDDYLSKYPILLMPLALALKAGQFKIIMRYVQKGGILVTGPWFGVCDEFGEPRSNNPGDRSVFPFGQAVPTWEEIENRPEIKVLTDPGSHPKNRRGVRANPLSFLSAPESVSLCFTGKNPIVKETRVGKGRIMQIAVDLGTLFRDSKSKTVVESTRQLMVKFVRPSVEIVNGEGLILGIFRKREEETVIHIQQFSPPWNTEGAFSKQPKTRWNSLLVWRGARPKSVRCVLPEPGPELRVTKRGDSWQVTLPPFVWGQVIIIKT